MGRLSFMFLGIVVGGAAIYGAFSFHIVKSDSGLTLVPKRSASLSDTYVDIRSYNMSDWAAHPALSADIVAAEKQQLMNGSAQGQIQNQVQGAVQTAIQDFSGRAR
jgi:hypothetical protein